MRLMPESSMVVVHYCLPRSTTNGTVRHLDSECRTHFAAEPSGDLSQQTKSVTYRRIVEAAMLNARHSVERRSLTVTMPSVPQHALLS